MSETKAKAYPMTIEVRNPADGKVVGEVPIETAETVAAKVRELRLFQHEWEAIGPKGRKAWLLKFQDWMFDNAEHIIDVLQSETGKSRVDASIEPTACADLLNYWAGSAAKTRQLTEVVNLDPRFRAAGWLGIRGKMSTRDGEAQAGCLSRKSSIIAQVVVDAERPVKTPRCPPGAISSRTWGAFGSSSPT